MHDDTDEYGTRYVAIYDFNSLDFSRGNVTGTLAYLTGADLDRGKFIEGS